MENCTVSRQSISFFRHRHNRLVFFCLDWIWSVIAGHFSIGSVGYMYLCFFLYIIKQDCSFGTKGFLINYYHGQLRKASDNWSCKYTCNFSEVKQSLLFKISLTETKNWKMRPINLVSSRVNNHLLLLQLISNMRNPKNRRSKIYI